MLLKRRIEKHFLQFYKASFKIPLNRSQVLNRVTGQKTDQYASVYRGSPPQKWPKNYLINCT